MVGAAAVGLAFGSITTTASAGPSDGRPASEPRDDERLAAPITMPRCPGVTIVEWRASRALPELTKPSPEGTKVLEDACATALARYPAFLRSRGLQFVSGPIAARVMAIPANTLLDGKDARNLNDVTGRFSAVQPTCCAWGIYDRSAKAVFLRNDPILRAATKTKAAAVNGRFTRTALHEMAHLLNDQWLVKAKNVVTLARDEELAEEWVGFLGIAYGTDSSSENYAMFADSLPPQAATWSIR